MSQQLDTESYEEIPYASIPFAQSHPDRLATVASVFGLTPPPVASATVLEVGCACGDNLLPLAAANPGMQLLGIDRSPGQIEEGRRRAAAFGLSNLRFECMDIMDAAARLDRFDYLIAHGVYSWVPPQVRDSLFDLARDRLSPHGIAYVSYNTLPGWHIKRGVRDLLKYHTRNIKGTREQVRHAGKMLEFAARAVPTHLPYPETKLYGGFLGDLVKRLQVAATGSDAYLCHEYLEEWNEPLYFHQFAEHVARHGLQYVAEADVSSMFAQDFAPQVSEMLATLGEDYVAREQYLDFLKNRPFRQSLLTHAAARPTRDLAAARLAGLHLCADLAAGEGGAAAEATGLTPFKTGSGIEFAADQPLTKCALLHLGEIWPRTIAFDALAAIAAARAGGGDAAALAAELAPLYAAGCIELHAEAPRFATLAGERPRASAWARHRARSGEIITNLRHGAVGVGPVFRHLIALMDGSRDRAALAASLLATAQAGELTLEAEAGAPERNLAELARIAATKHIAQAAEFALLEA